MKVVVVNLPFDLENKITWKELAPSLQSLFKTLQQQITKNAEDIENLNNRVDALEQKVDDMWEQIRTSIVPIGFIIPSQRVIPGWVKLDGSLYRRDQYPDLYDYAVTNNLIIDDNSWYNTKSNGTTRYISNRGYFSYGDGSTTFRVPDLRDCFIRGTDDGRGYDRGRAHMSEQLATLVGGYDDNHNDSDIGLLSSSTGGEHSDGNLVCDDWSGDFVDFSQYHGSTKQQVWWGRVGNRTVYSFSQANGWYAAVRPRNVAYYWIMKAEFGLDLNPGAGTGGGDDTGDIPTDPGTGDVEPDDPDGSHALQDQLEDLLNKIKNADPIGSIKYSYSIPEGWLECNGATISRTDYADLYSFAQNNNLLVSDSEWNNNNQGKFSYGNGSSTFRIPDIRGKFIRSLDSGAGIDSGRLIGTYQMDALQQDAFTNSASGQGSFYVESEGGPRCTGCFSSTKTQEWYENTEYKKQRQYTYIISINLNVQPSGAARLANETRSKNIALRTIIKAKVV